MSIVGVSYGYLMTLYEVKAFKTHLKGILFSVD